MFGFNPVITFLAFSSHALNLISFTLLSQPDLLLYLAQLPLGFFFDVLFGPTMRFSKFLPNVLLCFCPR